MNAVSEQELFLREIAVDWDDVPADSYLRTIPAISSLRQLCFHSPVTFFVGENGTGKSTILEAIAVAMGFNAEGGGREHLETQKRIR